MIRQRKTPRPANDSAGSLSDELRAAVAAARAAFSSEIAYQKARGAAMAGCLGKVAGFGALALALVFFVIMALVVGLLLALQAPLGPWGAMGAVIAGLLVATALAGLLAWRGWRRLKRLIAGKDS